MTTCLTPLELVRSGLSPQEVARTRGLGLQTVENHLAELVRRGELTVAAATALPEAEIRRIEAAFQGLPEGEKGYLKPLFERLGERYAYGVLKCVRAGLESARQVGSRP